MMNKILAFASILIFISSFSLYAQDNDKEFVFPSITIKDIESENFNTNQLSKESKPFVLVFWKSCCITGIQLLNELAEIYEDEELEESVSIYAVSVDDARTLASAKNNAATNDWPFKVLFDTNEDFKRAMGVNLEPFIFVFKSKKIVWSKNAYYESIAEEILDAAR